MNVHTHTHTQMHNVHMCSGHSDQVLYEVRRKEGRKKEVS